MQSIVERDPVSQTTCRFQINLHLADVIGDNCMAGWPTCHPCNVRYRQLTIKRPSRAPGRFTLFCVTAYRETDGQGTASR